MPAAVVPILVSAGVGTVAANVIGAVIAVGLTFLSSKLTRKPKAPNFAAADSARASRVTTNNDAIAPHKVLYGEARVGTDLVYYTTTQSDEVLHMVAVCAAHEIEEISAVYLNDEVVYTGPVNPMTDSNGRVITGRLSENCQIKVHLGAEDQAADPDLISEVDELDNNFRLRGLAYVYVRLTRAADGAPFPNGAPNISVRLKGKRISDPRKAAFDDLQFAVVGAGKFWTPNAALAAFDYLTDTFHGVGAPKENVDEAFLLESANRSDDIVDTAQVTQDSITDSVDLNWSTIKLQETLLKFQTGDRVTLSENNSTVPAPLNTTDSYFVIAIHERTDSNKQRVPTIRLATTYENALRGTHIPLTSAGSGVVTVTKTGEPRFTVNGPIDTSRFLRDNMIDLLSAMAGRLPNAGGDWRLIAGTFIAAGETINTTDMRDRPIVVTRHSRRDRFNRVKGVYYSPLQYDQPFELSAGHECDFSRGRSRRRVVPRARPPAHLEVAHRATDCPHRAAPASARDRGTIQTEPSRPDDPGGRHDQGQRSRRRMGRQAIRGRQVEVLAGAR